MGGTNKGIAYQVLTQVNNGQNTANSLAMEHLPNTVQNTTKTAVLTFTATGTTTYLAFNFGYVADRTTATVKIGNVKLMQSTTASQAKLIGLPGDEFKGWSTALGSTAVSYVAGGNYNLTDDITLYTVCESVVTYSYNLNKNYIDLVSDQVVCTYFTGESNDYYSLGKIYTNELLEGDVLKITFNVGSYQVSSAEGHNALLSFRATGNQTGFSPALIIGGALTHKNIDYKYGVVTAPITQEQLQNEYFEAMVELDFFKPINNSNVKIYNIKVERISKQDVKAYGTEIGTLPEPEADGYEFDGWYTSPTGGVRVTSTTTVPTNNVTYYAHWTPKTYTVTYNGNGSDGGTTASSTFTYDSAQNLAQNGFTRTGYRFAGWSTVPTTTCEMIMEDTGTYNYQVDEESPNYIDFKQYYIEGPFYEGDVYQVDVEIKSSGSSMSTYFYGDTNYLTVAKTTNSQGDIKYSSDGNNFIWQSTDYKSFTSTYTLSGLGDGNVEKRVLFRAYPGSEGSIKNIRIYKFSSGSPIYMDKESVKNLATSGNVTLYAVWKPE